MTNSRPHNNYFRVQGTLETFTFYDGSAESVETALAAAKAMANYHRSSRVPAVLVWRRTTHPEARSLTVIGEPAVSASN